MEIKQLRNQLERLKGQQDAARSTVLQLKGEISNLKKERDQAEQAREIVRVVGLKTQESLQYHISDIVSLALATVFDDPYELKVAFVQRRNKTECDLSFVRQGNEYDPMEASGFGAVDVASFALRVASWSMQHPRTHATIILDEPFRCLSSDRQALASQLLKELSTRLKIQFIIVTHQEILMDYADKTFKVQIKNGKSIVK